MILDNENKTATKFYEIQNNSSINYKIRNTIENDNTEYFDIYTNIQNEILKSGVKVYKYTPGFVHSKVFVSDDKIATIGTINLDYRSLYLHFECGCYMENVEAVKDIKNDLTDTIKKSHEITEKEITPNFLKWIWQALLRLVAPLM